MARECRASENGTFTLTKQKFERISQMRILSSLALVLLLSVVVDAQGPQDSKWSTGTQADNDAVTTYARIAAHALMDPAQLEVSCSNGILAVRVQWEETRWPRSDTSVNVAHRMRMGLFRTLTWIGAGDTMRVQDSDQHAFLRSMVRAYTLTVVLSGLEASAIFELGAEVRQTVHPVIDACGVTLER